MSNKEKPKPKQDKPNLIEIKVNMCCLDCGMWFAHGCTEQPA